MSAQSTPIEVFYSYAHEDQSLRDELEKHLSILHRQGLISSWHDRKILAGTDWAQTIDTHLGTASLVLLLLSSDFLASDYCYGIEMKRALERHQANEAQVIPILLRPVEWKGVPFEHLQVLPTDARPITKWSDRDDAFANVAAGIRRAIEDLPQGDISAPHGTLPSVWNVPYPRNPFFTGRDELLTHLTTTLKTGQPLAISGLGGIGKTQAAVEYAHQRCHDYQEVFWTLADTRESLISGYITIAQLLKLPEKDKKDQQIIIEAVKVWLQTHGSWLLILDNADDLAVVREFIPTAFGGYLLLTTRAQSLGRLAKRVEVETMDQNVGALFLLRRAGLIAENASLGTASSEDITIARSICEELGGLPLALDQAGAYIEETNCSLINYLATYRKRQGVLLLRRGGLVDDHPASVATTWSLSFDKVQQRSPVAVDLLCVCAFLAADAIPEEIIIESAKHLGPHLESLAEDAMGLDEAFAALGKYSLLHRQRETATLSIHRLVQTVLRDTMDEQTRHLWAERTVLAVNEVFPVVEFSTWTQCERYLPHALACAELVEQEKITSPKAAHLLNATGCYLYERASYTEAETLHRRALTIREQQLGANHPDTATSLYNLAMLYDDQSKHTEAETLYLRALTIREQQLGANHPDTATSLNGLAVLYKNQGKHTEAETLYLRALTIREQQLGANHPSTATSLNNLAVLYLDQENYVEAESLLLRALTIREQVLGKHPDTGNSMWRLATIYEQQYEHDKAELWYERALSTCKRTLGWKHPHTQEVQQDYVSFRRTRDRNEKDR